MRRVRRKGGNKEKVFGCDLLEHLNASSQEIPLVLKCCSEFVETHGIVDGIYRLSGVSSNIQKLRGEFESDGTPDLNKDLYLQDIHCVSSLCKAYFRELPNPLLTYQLYDKFAEAVAIQLEEERLVKIRDVLKELPRPHYRTLEFLMRHLVRMASYSSETNMHARNLAIVWAPNLLRSKDIEASGFNGTAAFMEVRVQSIVVEFILTHVPQLFPEQGVSNDRRNSLPSPTAAPNQEEVFFRSAALQPVPNFGNISPGDGPLAMRPYHAIIEGTDKRKGSLKGRKWMSIFNIGGRFHDPRRRHKNSAKEKDRTSLRPARSMDSLSSPSFPNEGSRRSGQRPPSTTPLATPSPQPASDAAVPSGAIGGSEYAVTFRRGTGLVSGGSGTQGTYTALDPEGLGGNETVQSRSPGLSTKVGRRAAMHITGPTMVTVPLHITSNLAQGVLQGGGGDRVIHRGRDKDRGDKVEGKEGGEKESRGMEWKVEEGTKVEEEEKNLRGKETDGGVVAAEEGTVGGAGREEGGEEEEREEKKEEEERKKEEEKEEEKEVRDESVSVSREQRVKSVNSSSEGDKDDQSEYIDMKGMNPANVEQEVPQCADDRAFDASEILNSTEVEGDDLGLSGYVQDNFEFLDQMDCSVMDHMDCSVSYQVNEFSVEPPCHSDDEYEVMAQAAEPAELQMHLQPGHDPHSPSPTELKPRRPLSLDVHSRHTKSLSLPHMTSPVQGPEESSSEDEAMLEDSEDDDYGSEDDMFVKSLPPDFFLKLTDSEADAEQHDCCAVDEAAVSLSQSSEEEEGRSQTPEPPACKESAAGEQALEEEEKDALKEKETTGTVEENHQDKDRPENNMQSKVMEGDHSVMEVTQSEQEPPPTQCCAEDPPQSNDDSDKTAEEEREVVDNPHGDVPHCSAVSCVIQEERADDQSEETRDFSVKETEPPRTCTREDTNESDGDKGEDREEPEVEDTCEGGDVEVSGERRWEENTEQHGEVTADLKHEEKMQESGKEQHSAVRRTSSEIWDEFGDVICEVLEDLESEHNEENGGKESDAGDGDGIKTVEEAGEEEEEEQVEKASGEEMGEAERVETDKTEERIEVVEDSTETKLRDTEKELEEKDTSQPKTTELDEATKRNDEEHNRRREEEVSKKVEKERADEQDTPPSEDKQQKDMRSDVKEMKEGRKCEESDSVPGGVGRKLIATKHPKVYQVKAVPVVPPKPQHCKITALTIRHQQQQQQRERRDADRGRETTLRVGPGEQGRDGADGDEGRGRKEKPAVRGGEKERERRGDGDDNATRDASRNSPHSMCFDEAVAIATMRREKEKECEREKERHWGNETQ